MPSHIKLYQNLIRGKQTYLKHCFIDENSKNSLSADQIFLKGSITVNLKNANFSCTRLLIGNFEKFYFFQVLTFKTLSFESVCYKTVYTTGSGWPMLSTKSASNKIDSIEYSFVLMGSMNMFDLSTNYKFSCTSKLVNLVERLVYNSQV